MKELMVDLSPEEIRARGEAAQKWGGPAVRIRRQLSPPSDTIVKNPAAGEKAIDRAIDEECGLGMAKLLDEQVIRAMAILKQRRGQ